MKHVHIPKEPLGFSYIEASKLKTQLENNFAYKNVSLVTPYVEWMLLFKTFGNSWKLDKKGLHVRHKGVWKRVMKPSPRGHNTLTELKIRFHIVYYYKYIKTFNVQPRLQTYR